MSRILEGRTKKPTHRLSDRMHDASVSRFPLDRALTGLKSAGFRHVAWGVTHKEADGEKHVLDADAPPDRAKEWRAVAGYGPRAGHDVFGDLSGE